MANNSRYTVGHGTRRWSGRWTLIVLSLVGIALTMFQSKGTCALRLVGSNRRSCCRSARVVPVPPPRSGNRHYSVVVHSSLKCTRWCSRNIKRYHNGRLGAKLSDNDDDDNDNGTCHYVFGYGSLMCAESRRLTNPTLANDESLSLPVLVRDWQRVWSARTSSGYTAMGLETVPGASCSGVLLPVASRQALADLDRREASYYRCPMYVLGPKMKT
jgi:hypothetical protein